jgi:2,4-dienoyl-CoA reductase-like NADH-dependent reductase (Old Yellow Enzyme family)
MRDATAKGRPLGHAGRPERAARGERNGTHTHPEKVTRGESHATSKLTDNQVREIRAAYATGVHIAQIARAHGVSWSNVKFIVNGTHWKHLL